MIDRKFRRIIGAIKVYALALVTLLLSAIMMSPVYTAFAQETETTTAPASAPAGVGVLILLVGLGALLAVGVYYVSLGRPQTAGTPAATNEDEDE